MEVQPKSRIELSRRQEIIAAALVLLKNTSLHSLKMEAVARDANVSKATLYKYFGSRQVFLDEVVTSQLSPKRKSIQDVIRNTNSVHEAVHTTMAKLLRDLLSVVATCGPACLTQSPVHLYLQETIKTLDARLSEFDLRVPRHLSVMACAWVYGLAVTAEQFSCLTSSSVIDLQAAEAATLLLAGHPELHARHTASR